MDQILIVRQTIHPDIISFDLAKGKEDGWNNIWTKSKEQIFEYDERYKMRDHPVLHEDGKNYEPTQHKIQRLKLEII